MDYKMKKLLLTLLIALTAISISNAQIYTINSKLRLNTVDEGTAEDSIMVYGVDKVIRHVKRSDLLPSNELSTQTLDAYNGTRAILANSSLTGFHVQQSSNKNIGFSVFNDDAVGNAAQANVTVKGSGALYTNNTGISHYNNGYYVSWLRNSGLFYSDSPLYVATWNSNPIDFKTGAAFTSLTSKFKINANGQLAIGVAPTTDNAATNLLGRDASGNVVSVEKTSLSQNLQQVLDNGNSSTTALSIVNGPSTNNIQGGTQTITNASAQASIIPSEIKSSNLTGKYALLSKDGYLGFNSSSNVAGSRIYSDNVTAIRNLQVPDADGTIATQEYVDLHNLQKVFDADAGYIYAESPSAIVEDDGGALALITKPNAWIQLSNSNANLTFKNVSGDDGEVTFTDGRIVKKGIEYAANYAAGFTARSLIDKQYVDESLLSTGLQTITDNGNSTTNSISVANLTVNGIAKAEHFKINALNTPPASSTDTGEVGEIRITSGAIYVCIASDTWVKADLATF